MYYNYSVQAAIFDFYSPNSFSSEHQSSVITTITPFQHPRILFVTARPSRLRVTCPPAPCRGPGCPCLSHRGGPCPPLVAPAAPTPASLDRRPLTSDLLPLTAPTIAASTASTATPAPLQAPAVCPPPGR